MGKRDWTTHITNINSLLLSKLLCWTIIHFIKSNWTTYNTKYTEPANNKLLNKLKNCDTNCKVRTLLDEDRWLFWLKALGWGLPIIPMLPYVAFRLTISHFHFHTFTFPLSQFHFRTFTHSLSHFRTLTFSLSHFHTFTYTVSFSQFHFHTFTLGPHNHTRTMLFPGLNFHLHTSTFTLSLSYPCSLCCFQVGISYDHNSYYHPYNW